MLKRNSFAAVTLFSALAACSSQADPLPQPDPAKVERLVMSLEAQEAAPPAAMAEKLAKAERVVAAVDRSEPDRLAGAAERLLAR